MIGPHLFKFRRKPKRVDEERDIQELITQYVDDLVALAKRILRQSPNYSRIRSVINMVRQIAVVQTSLLDDAASAPIFPEKILKALYEQLDALLTENNRCSTWFTKVVECYCHEDHELKQRLNYFIRRMIGPVIKLSESVQDKQRLLAIEFPTQEMRDIFLNQSGMNKETDGITLEENRVYFPAFLSGSQQLGVTFANNKSKERFIHMLNLDKAYLVVSNANDCTLYINDRRIHDTASRFYIALICPYFTEYYKIQYASHMLAQAHRDIHSFFSPAKFPTELTVKIASHASSSDAISMDEKLQVAKGSFGRP